MATGAPWLGGDATKIKALDTGSYTLVRPTAAFGNEVVVRVGSSPEQLFAYAVLQCNDRLLPFSILAPSQSST